MPPTQTSRIVSRLLSRQINLASTETPLAPGDWRHAAERHPEDLVVESWSEGFLVGALLVMACITMANMRRKVLLHKLILLELFLAMMHGTFCFMSFKGYGWYLSSTATLLYISWVIHNVVAWMKVRPFFTHPGGFFPPKTGLWVKWIYLGTLSLTVPAIAFEISNNFRYFNNRGGWYQQVRPYEALMRDPWWVFTCITLFHVIRKCYGAGIMTLIKNSPRLGILLSSIFLAMAFTVCDIVASIHSFIGDATDGINPFWKLSLVFKCLTDTIMLDDFKTELKRLGTKRIAKEEARRKSVALVTQYPSGLDGPDPTAYSRPRQETLVQFNTPSPHQDATFDSDSTMIDERDHSATRRDSNVDPLSDYAADQNEKKESRQQRHSGTNNPSANLQEVEFATALNLDPSQSQHLTSSDSTDRPPTERHNIGTTTRKIKHLPGLKDFSFKTSNMPWKQKRNQKDTEGYEPHGWDWDSERSRTRSLAEEIQRTTIMDLEAQRRESDARRMRLKKEREERENDKIEEDEAEDDGDDDDDDDDDEYDDDGDETKRLQRFKGSIGAHGRYDDDGV